MSVTHNPNLALVGMHGPPEITGQALKQSCDEDFVAGWDVLIANQAAVDAGMRYKTHNMALQFGPQNQPVQKNEAN